MIIHDLVQGSSQWHAHRASYYNASDAPAMMGVSKHESRTELLQRLHTGISKEIDSATQARFDEGHLFERLSRPIAENIIGDDFHPVTGSNGMYSASFDGITLDQSICFEHKRINNDIRLARQASDLGICYRIQMEQQLMVSCAEKCFFMASNWLNNKLIEEVHFFYMPDLELRQKIVAGWAQFEKDLASYVPVEAIEKPKANAIKELPYLNIQLHGEVVNSNLPAVQQSITTFIANIKTDLVTDEDFADAEATVKFCKDAEDSLENAKKSALSQTSSIDELMRTIDFIKEQLRGKRLILDKAVTSEKEKRKLDIVNKAKNFFIEYMRLHLPITAQISVPDFMGAIKGKKTLSSMQSAVNDLLAQGEIDIDEQKLIIKTNLAIFDKIAINHKFLFSDLDTSFIQNNPELFELKVKDRIAKYEIEQKELTAKKEVVEPVIEPKRLVMQNNSVLKEIPLNIISEVNNDFNVPKGYKLLPIIADDQWMEVFAIAFQLDLNLANDIYRYFLN